MTNHDIRAAFYSARDRKSEDGMIAAISQARQFGKDCLGELLEDLDEWRYKRTAKQFP
jgi:hypothetical protein